MNKKSLNKNLKQHVLLKMIITALIDTLNEINHIPNEATLKHLFFYYLKLKSPDYIVSVEENIGNHIKMAGRADYYLLDNSLRNRRIRKSPNTYKNDIVIEFKIDCYSKKLIKHDIVKLEKIKKINSSIATIFINYFTNKLDFLKFKQQTDLFAKTKIYAIAICPEVENYYYRRGYEIINYPLNTPTIITSCARLLEQRIIPPNIPTIRIPNLNGMTKYINLYPRPKSKKQIWGNNMIRFCDPIHKN